MTLRIAGGQFRGRNLKTPESSATRPTTEMVRQAVFNICQEWVPNARFLDVFAGSGAMGFEAISRGASFATFAENDPEASKCIIENSEKLAIQKQVQILISDARLSLAKLSTPYDKDATDLLQLIVEKKLLVSNGLLFYEERFDSKKIPTCLGLDLIQSKKYGITHLHQYRLSTI
jgi:16S rRNA (guanine966-N2)-methyltransferase